jgi:hypothetical protein
MTNGMDDKNNLTRLPTASASGGGNRTTPPSYTGQREGDQPNDAAWLEVYIARAAEQIDFGPVKRRIRDRKLAATEAEALNGIQVGINLAARTAQFIPLPPARDPWEDTNNDD